MLKPCPFCGKKPEIEYRAALPHDPVSFPAFVRISCGKLLGANNHHIQTQAYNLPWAVKLWNEQNTLENPTKYASADEDIFKPKGLDNKEGSSV